jgi:triacylglycerol lipase
MGEKLETTLAILNGVLGDHLARTGNGLATDMVWMSDGQPLAFGSASFATRYASPSARVVVLVHGIMNTEAIWRCADGSDYGVRLATDLGFTPFYLRYNTGRAIADSGADLCALLEKLVESYPRPIEELLLLGYSMGGLVIRSACHFAGIRELSWLSKVRRAIYLGTPHRGSPLERAGRALARTLRAIEDPYTQLIGDIANLRSAGIQDLGLAHLRHEDRAAAVSDRLLRDRRHPVPLLASQQHYLIASSWLRDPLLALLFGDALVSLFSATDGACSDVASRALPPDHVKVIAGLAHLELPRHPDVYRALREFCERD